MDILITGSTGFLGKEVKLALKKYNYKLLFIGNKKIKNKNYIYCDLKKLKELNSILKDINPDIVINLAAQVNFGKKNKDMYKINTLCPYVIAKFCKSNGSHLIQASTIMVHGIKSSYGIKTKYSPINNYGKSKLAAENLIKKTNCRYSIIRFGGIYGKYGPGHLGINKFIKASLKGKDLNFNGNIESIRNYIFVKDAARVITNCIKNNLFGTFYAAGQSQSFKKMIYKINSILGKNGLVNFKNTNQARFDQVITNSNIIKPISFEKSLKSMI
tara:strand:- start:666 stop:1481 length:816 start_codon:yes stop_codon:yes gene_type:complete